VLTGHRGVVEAVAVTPDGQRAVTGSADCSVGVWDLATGARLATFGGFGDTIAALAVTPDGRGLLAGSGDSTVRFYDLERLEELTTLHGHRARVWDVEVTVDGSLGVSVSGDTTLRVWDLRAGAPLATFTADNQLYACLPLPDGATFIGTGAAGLLEILRLEPGR
jgi:WD40 repeat protein